MSNKQSQKAGDNAQQIQADVVNIIQGITEEKAREISLEVLGVVRKELTQDAYDLANGRAQKLEDLLILKMAKLEGALNAFSDPGFQILLASAHKAAAATERQEDYELLAELLLQRVEKGEDRHVRAGISQAIKIVDEVSSEALLGLSAVYTMEQIGTTHGNILEGLIVLDELFASVLYGRLPQGKEWLEHLDILNLVRILEIVGLNRVEQMIPEIYSGYIGGIEKNSTSYNKAVDILNNVSLEARKILVPHELRDDFVRIPVPNKELINQLKLVTPIGLKRNSLSSNLSDEQYNAVHEIYAMYTDDASIKEENATRFMEEWDKKENLRKIKQWWNSIP